MTFEEFLKYEEGFKGTFLRSIPLTAAILGANYMTGGPMNKAVESIVDKLSPADYISKKKVIPYEIIRNSQINPLKWDNDYKNLQAPTVDQGFATHKDLFKKPITLYVFDDKKIKQISPTSIAFKSGDSVYLSSKLFDVLPTRYTDGKLSKTGIDALSHELRHGTQATDAVPENLRQKDNSNFEKFYKQYMNDPQEVGVRVAALKNLLNKETIRDSLKDINISIDFKNFIIENLPEEKVLLYSLVSPDAWSKELSDKYAQQQPNMFKDVSYEKTFKIMIKKISDHLRSLNNDVDSLLKFIDSLTEEEKYNFLRKIIDIYDQVVQRANFSLKSAV